MKTEIGILKADAMAKDNLLVMESNRAVELQAQTAKTIYDQWSTYTEEIKAEHLSVIAKMNDEKDEKDKELITKTDELNEKDKTVDDLKSELDLTKSLLKQKLQEEKERKEQFEGLNEHVFKLLKSTFTLQSYFTNERDLEHSTAYMSKVSTSTKTSHLLTFSHRRLVTSPV